jgi:phosphatidylinositol alpha-1,6-mannosyltransferase
LKQGGSRSVLICAKGYPPDVGGVQTYSEYVARAYLKSGLQPIIVSSRPGPRGWTDLAYPEGRARLWNVGSGKQALLFLRMLVACRRILRDESVAFVHPTTWRPALAVAPFRGANKMLLTVHGQEVLGPPTYLARPMRRMLRAADAVVAVSRPTLAAARSALPGENPRGDWFASFNGLSYETEARAFERPQREGNCVRLYTFCRLAERKNVSGALAALKIVRDRGIDNFRYTIAGSGPLKQRIAEEIVALGLSERVEMTGYIDEVEIPDRYRNCDVFLHPQTAPGGTDLEGFGLAIADAMSFGALAIVGQAGGPADFVRDHENGRIVDGERVETIATALADALTDRTRSDSLAASGRAWALENLSWDRHIADILSHMQALGAAL